MGELDRRQFLGSVAAAVAATAAGTGRAETAGLFEPAFRPLPLGAIRPAAGCCASCGSRRDGLTGHLDEFWPDVAESQWFGGDGRGLGARALLARRRHPARRSCSTTRRSRQRLARHVDHIVSHQRADGWYGPYPKDAGCKRYDMWAILLANKALVQYHEATGDARVLEAVRTQPARAPRRPRPHAALRLGQVPLVRGPRARRSTCTSGRGEPWLARPRPQAARAGRRLRGAVPHRGRHACRRRGAACGSGRSTSSTRRWPPKAAAALLAPRPAARPTARSRRG